jgi:hypothetical protein
MIGTTATPKMKIFCRGEPAARPFLQAISKPIFSVTLSDAKGLRYLKWEIFRCAQNDTFERIEVLKLLVVIAKRSFLYSPIPLKLTITHNYNHLHQSNVVPPLHTLVGREGIEMDRNAPSPPGGGRGPG